MLPAMLPLTRFRHDLRRPSPVLDIVLQSSDNESRSDAQSSQSHGQRGDLVRNTLWDVISLKISRQTRCDLAHPFIVALQQGKGHWAQEMVTTWPAHGTSNCQAYCKSGTHDSALHNMSSSSNLASMAASSHAAWPTGVPRILMPSGLSGLSASMSGGHLSRVEADASPWRTTARLRDHREFCICQERMTRTHRREMRTILHDSLTSDNALWTARLKRRGINGSLCSPPHVA